MSLKITQILIRAVTAACVFSSVVLSASAQSGNAGNTPFTGVWETVTGSNFHYTVQLTQIGKKVTGTFSPGSGKIVDGKVIGNKVTFRWTHSKSGSEGTGEFVLDEDYKGFKGSSSTDGPLGKTTSWNTYTLAASSYAGTWETTIAFRTVHLSITQKGVKVTGTYPSENGTLEGTVSGKILRFTWESDAGSGSGQFGISTSGMTFSGWFNEGDDSDVEGTRWEGIRRSGGKITSPEKVVEPTFDGVWSIVETSGASTLVIRQSGAFASGVFGTNRGAFELKNTHVNGNLLRFTVIGRRADVPVSIAELVLAADGKSFNGTINGDAVAGTFVRAN